MKKIRNIKICHLHNANKIGQKICNQYDAWNEKKMQRNIYNTWWQSNELHFKYLIFLREKIFSTIQNFEKNIFYALKIKLVEGIWKLRNWIMNFKWRAYAIIPYILQYASTKLKYIFS